MPDPEELTPDQVRRQAMVIRALAGAGWDDTNSLWGSGIATEWVAIMTLGRFGTAWKCEYIVKSKPVSASEMSEFIIVQWNFPDREIRLVVDFLNLTTDNGQDQLAGVLAALVAAQYSDGDGVTIAQDALRRICPVFEPHQSAMGHLATLGEEEEAAQVGGYADPIEDLLYRELTPSGWRPSPVDVRLSGLLETFYFDNGTAKLSVGRVNMDETRIQVTVGEKGVVFRIDDLNEAAHADRLIALLRHWQDRIGKSLNNFVAELGAAYPKVFLEGDDGDWIRTGLPTRSGKPVSPPAGIDQRVQWMAGFLGKAGWSQAERSATSAVSMQMTNKHDVTLRCDYIVDTMSEIPESMILNVSTTNGEISPFDQHSVLIMDVFDLRSGRGGRDRLPAALRLLAGRQHTVNTSTMGSLVRALSLCCPILLGTKDGQHRTLVTVRPSSVDDVPAVLPRSLTELDRLIASDPNSSAELWLERGLAASADDRLDLAVESYDESIRRNPDYGPAHFHRACVIGPADPDEAGRGFGRCVQLGFAVGPAILRHGLVLGQVERPDEALGIYRHLTERLPDYAPGWYQRGLGAVKRGLHAESVAATTEAIRLRPDDGNAYYTRACALALTDEAKLAIRDIEEAIALDMSLRSQIRDDDDFSSLRDDPQFISLVDPQPVPGDDDKAMQDQLADMLRTAGWRHNDVGISLGLFSSLEYHCPAGLLIVGQAEERIYVNLRPYGRGEDGEVWLYIDSGEDTEPLGQMVVAWQANLTAENFPEFAKEIRSRFPKTSWYYGHP